MTSANRPGSMLAGLTNRRSRKGDKRNETLPASTLLNASNQRYNEKQDQQAHLIQNPTPTFPQLPSNNNSTVSRASTYDNVSYEFILKENEMLRKVISKKNKEIANLTSEITILRNQNTQFKTMCNHLQNNDDTVANVEKGKFTIARLFLQLRLFNRPTRDELQNKRILQNELCFDNDLDKIPQHEIVKHVPKILVDVIQYLEGNSFFMRSHGLYRISGNHVIVQKLRLDIDNNKYYRIKEQRDPHNITSILKLFLRELKAPLISYDQLNNYVPTLKSLADDSLEAKICKLQKLYYSLPKANQLTLKYFIKHLQTVASVPENSMNAQHLSIVIGPCVFFDMISNVRLSQQFECASLPIVCIRTMIENYNDIFVKQYLMLNEESSSEEGDEVSSGSYKSEKSSQGR